MLNMHMALVHKIKSKSTNIEKVVKLESENSIKQGHVTSEQTTSDCENQHPFVCERPAAALEGSEFKGT